MPEERDDGMRRDMDLMNRRAAEYDAITLPLKPRDAEDMTGTFNGLDALTINSSALRATEAAKPAPVACNKHRARRRRVKRSR